ncbi:MAG TPA: TonB-dependent receptor, partial [Chitinophagaceae bacterium]|nr:TonB-dependent receptor [Chitinophagaceae bacterium]
MKQLRRYSIMVWLATAGWPNTVFAGKVTGDVIDREHRLPISAASVQIPGIGFRISSPDGFFSFAKLPAGRYRLIVSALGYKTDSLLFSVNDQSPLVLHVFLQPVAATLDTIRVTGSIDRSSEIYGRAMEKASTPLMHVISRQSIEQSADITVADIMQRVSGVSVLRNETGMPGKAFIRGMDPKYSYTAVNGMAIPSTNDRSRYLSLDLFPTGIIDHLEVYKSLTAEMAGDAIGGLINIVTRPVPADKAFSVQLATGYSQVFLQRRYMAFNSRVVQTASPYERYGPGYQATGNDFTKDNLSFYSKHPIPDIQGDISWSKRFLSQKFGVMIAGGLQSIRSGSDGFLILQNNEPQVGNIPGITDFVKRQYSTTSNRKNIYVALDYKINAQSHLRLYQLFVNKLDIESRSAVDTSLSEGRSGPGTGRIAVMQRSRLHRQSIEHLDLQGDHQLSRQLSLNWSGVYSDALGSYPDWAELGANTGRILGANGQVDQTPELLAPLKRTWLHNKEREGDIYANLHYKPGLQEQLAFSGGVLLQYRHRDNFYNNYLFTPAITSGNGQPFTNIYDAVWYNNNGPQNPLGTVNTSGTYTARENIGAWYVQARFHAGKVKINAGIREEQTVQHVSSAADPGTQFGRDISIRYRDWLPSVHIRYALTEKQDLKLSYFRAISRPSLYDITFFNMDYDDYNVAGNPFLKRSTAANFDLRYELYAPGILDELQVTAFYKHIKDPYEKTLLSAADTLYPIPENGLSYIPASKLTEQLRNYGEANNYGFEFSVVKNFNKICITANYTFTSSRIDQAKKYKQREEPQNPASGVITVTRLQQRPLQGQSKHLANLSLSYRLPRYGWTAQLLGVYTGRRINEVSGWYELDDWQKGSAMLDFSLEKVVGKRWRFFAKAANLLHAGTRVYVHGNMA